MVTAVVQFTLPRPLTQAEARERFSSTALKYRDVQGLLRKYYLLSDDGSTAGGVYLWRSREDAERLYTDQWRQFIQDSYGAAPAVTFFDTPVVVDNLEGVIVR